MLKKVKKTSDNDYTLEISLEGKEYQQALANYSSFIPDYLKESFESDLFPKGKTPLAVIEERHGNELYRYILEAKFPELYHEAEVAADIKGGSLKEVEIVSFSKEQILLNALVKTRGPGSSGNTSNGDNFTSEATEPSAILKTALDDISASEKLVITPTCARDEFFWEDLRDVCAAYVQDLPNDLMSILAQIGVVNAKGGAVLIDVNDNDPYKLFYPVIELSLFPCAVFAAALREYIPNFSEEDESNLQRYIFSCAENILSLCEQMGGNSKKILCDRLSEYALACKNESLCGLSLYGQFGFDYDGLRCWTKDHQVKCAHILCDHIVYIKNFRELATFEDLERLKPIVETNSEQELRKLMKLFGELFTTSCAIFMTVRGALNGGRKIRWRAEGLCQYCGREFKKTLLGSKCPACKIKKDY